MLQSPNVKHIQYADPGTICASSLGTDMKWKIYLNHYSSEEDDPNEEVKDKMESQAAVLLASNSSVNVNMNNESNRKENCNRQQGSASANATFEPWIKPYDLSDNWRILENRTNTDLTIMEWNVNGIGTKIKKYRIYRVSPTKLGLIS